MPYRPTALFSTFLGYQLGPSASAIVPASIQSGFAGTLTLIAITIGVAVWKGEVLPSSPGEAITILITGGAALALGTIAGTFVVAFYLTLFGLPISLFLGDAIRKPVGLFVAITCGLATSLIALSWHWGASLVHVVSGSWQALIPILAFSLPAMVFYRHQIISMRDALDEF